MDTKDGVFVVKEVLASKFIGQVESAERRRSRDEMQENTAMALRQQKSGRPRVVPTAARAREGVGYHPGIT